MQDPIGATEVPLQMLRGRVAGTLGLPSDVLNVVRSPMPMEMFGDVDYSQQKLLPYGTSQLLKELPLAPTSRVGEVAGEIGSVAPMTPAEALKAARLARQAALAGDKAVMAVGKAGERYAERVVPQVMARGGMPAQLLGDLSQGSRRQIFIGQKSKSWNKGAEELALKMEKAGNTPEDIWMATGTFRGPEGKLRQEISDTGAKLTLGQGKPDAYGAIEAKTFEGALEHPRLQQAYPELNEVKFQHWPKEEYQGATFDPNDNVITMGQKAMEPERGVALHELQHAIQRKEGFAKGGSPSTVLNDWYAGINSELSSLSKQMDALPEFERKFNKAKQAQYDVLRTKYDDLMNQKLYEPPDADEAYRRLAGEAEARAVQKRMNYSDVQRRVIYPYESYDVAPNNLIIKKTDGIAESTNGLRESRNNAQSIVREGNPIQSAVVLIGDKIFTGRTHGDALNRAIYEGVVRKEGGKYIYPKGAEVDSDLFMTKDGQIIDRLQASKMFDIGASETAIKEGLMQNKPPSSMSIDAYMKQAEEIKNKLRQGR